LNKEISLYKKKIGFILLILLVLTIPLKEDINTKMLLSLTVFSLFFAIRERSFNLKKLKNYLPFFSFYLFVLFSLAYTSNIKYGIESSIKLAPLIALPLIFSVIKITKKEFFILIKIIIGWVLILALFSHYTVVKKLIDNNDTFYNIVKMEYSYKALADDAIGIHRSYYAYYVITTILFLTFLTFYNNYIKAFLFLSILYLSFFVFHLSVRTALLGLFVVINLFILQYFVKQNNLKKGLFYLLLFYIIVALTGYNVRVTRYRFQQIFGFTFHNGPRHDDGQDKINQWKSSIDANKDFLFGNGIGDAKESIIDSYVKHNMLKDAERKFNAHNQYIQTYVGLGLLGLLLLFWIFYYYFIFFIKNKLYLGYMFMVVSSILFITESYLERQKGVVVFTFFICLFINIVENNVNLSSRGSQVTPKRHS
jgi:O-antigen ligase